MSHFDIAITGAGAAGMMAAISAARTGASVCVIEKMPKPGRKIIISGKGRCNFTNLKQWNDFSAHIHPKAGFCKPAFYGFTPEDVISFFEENGMKTVTERGDRVFPASYKSTDVVDTLMKTAKKEGAVIMTGSGVTGMTKDGENFRISLASGRTISAGKLLIATGGLSYPGTGSTGDGYVWARNFGHTISDCFPSLTALVPEGYKTAARKTRGHIDRTAPLSELGRSLMGNRLKNISASLAVDGNTVEEEFGDIDFTDGGIEGPVGFRLSRRCVHAIAHGSRAVLTIDLKPAAGEEELSDRIASLWDEISSDARSRGKSFRDKFRILLGKLMPYSLTAGFMHFHPDAGIHSLAGLLKNWKFRIDGYVGYERCVVTAGGVVTNEVCPKTMESRLVPGLYFAGEVLDVDCDTGGYNMQWAFCSGWLAGKSAAASLLG